MPCTLLACYFSQKLGKQKKVNFPGKNQVFVFKLTSCKKNKNYDHTTSFSLLTLIKLDFKNYFLPSNCAVAKEVSL